MRYRWMILNAILLVTLFPACQPDNRSTLVPQSPVVSTTEPGSESNAAQTKTPAPTQEEIPMTPVTPSDESAETMVALVKQHLAQKLGIAVEQIVLIETKPVVWRDASLGCPKPAIDYIQVETPGYRILLQAGGTSYTYHTDETKRFVQCSQ